MPTGGAIVSMKPSATSDGALMRGAKLTVSKYNADRMTSGSVDVQFGYPALRPCRSPLESAPEGSLTMTAVTASGRRAAVTSLCWPPMLVPVTTIVLPSQSGRDRMSRSRGRHANTC